MASEASVEREPHPPVRELVDYDRVAIEIAFAGGSVIVVSGTQPDHFAMALEETPGIPERGWVRFEVVGYHFGEYRPGPQPYTVACKLPDLPPGTEGIEIVGARGKTTRIPLSG
jgi:hypothetical protein